VSPLEDQLGDYLRIRRALGYKLARTEKLLAQYIAFLEQRDEHAITIENTLAWPDGHVAVTTFRCVNCGAGTSLPTFLAIVFGGVGALAAAYSIRNQAREQRRLTTELTRRADFAIAVALAHVVAVEHALLARQLDAQLRHARECRAPCG
jgi:hypothetical protein